MHSISVRRPRQGSDCRTLSAGLLDRSINWRRQPSGFFEAGKRLLKRARFARQPTALIVFDLDRFKSINDRYGHHTGDEVLTAFCRLATPQLRPNDLFGRIGGEEFGACYRIPGTMTPSGSPSGFAVQSKPLPTPLDKMHLS